MDSGRNGKPNATGTAIITMQPAPAWMFFLWGMVIRQFGLLLLARELLDGNASSGEVQRALGLHEFVAQKVTNQARKFSMPALESIYHKLLEIDEDAKTSRVPLDLALDTLVVGLIH